MGQAGRTSLLAAYLGTDEQVHDFRTLQDHHAPRTESQLLFKGAVADTARSVYSGLIQIRKGARGSNAFQTNHNLVLSEGAHADSVPNLDIDENDVRCSHASTVGPIDEEQRYYLETAGDRPRRWPNASSSSASSRTSPAGPRSPAWVGGSRTRSAGRMAGRLVGAQGRQPMGDVVRLCGRDEIDSGDGTALRRRSAPDRAGAHRGRLLRHRRHAAATRTTRSPKARCSSRRVRSSAGSTGRCSTCGPASRRSLPATKPVPVYVVRVDGDDVLVELP